jgi:hypothetical protein
VFSAAADQQEQVLEVAGRVQRPATDTSRERMVPAPTGDVDLDPELLVVVVEVMTTTGPEGDA